MQRFRHKQRSPETPPAPRRLGAPGADGGSRAVQVESGALSETLDLAGMSVGEAQRLLQGVYNVGPQQAVRVNGQPATADRELVAGDVLEFERVFGEKGVEA